VISALATASPVSSSAWVEPATAARSPAAKITLTASRGPRHPLPMNGILVAVIVRNCTFASRGSDAM
jgi:hypothetical protein